jgi:hypothetical protein
VAGREGEGVNPLRKITASKLDLAMKCAHWTEHRLPYDKPGAAAAIGTAFHELVATGTHAQELDDEGERIVSELWEVWKRDGARRIRPDASHEVAFEYMPSGTVRCLGAGLERDYGMATGICGTVDAIDRGTVIDFKTGKARVSAAESWQLRFAAVCAVARRMAFVYVRPDGLEVDGAEVTPAQLKEWESALETLIGRVSMGDTPPRPGEHCDGMYCPARNKCDAYKTMRAEATREETMGKMTLANVKKGRLETPLSVVLYGPEGIGKSTWGAGAPSPIFLGAEDGTFHLDVARFPVPDTWAECMEALDVLAKESHDYKTVVIDTADWLEPLIHAHVCKQGGKKSIEDFGYGKGYVSALDQWRDMLARLDALRIKGMHVVVLAHSQVKAFRNPAGDDYDRYELKIHTKAAALLKEWAHAVLFATYETYTHEKDGRVRAVGDGSRIVHTEHRPAWDAKNRYGLPAEMPLDWPEFEGAARAGEPVNVDAVMAQIDALIAQAPSDVQDKAASAKERAGNDARKVSQLLDWLKGKVSEQQAA